MATSSPSFLKLANNDFSAGSSFVVNKGANGSTASAVVVFNSFNGNMVTSKTFGIGSVKVGGQNLFTEEIKIEATFGAYSDSGGFIAIGSLGSCTVSESDKTTSRTITDNTTATVADGYYPAVKITVSSTKSARGAEVVMSSFTLSLTYYAKCTITTAASPTSGGTVSGGGVYDEDDKPTLTATPSNGYKFVKWQDGNTDNPRKITVSGNATYTAYFEKLKYTVSTAVTPSGSGTVTGGGTYEHGATATLTATANSGYKFIKWNDNVTTNPRKVTVTGAATYTANFEKLPPEFTSASMTYLNKQISASNKVIHNEGFIISVGVK